MNCVSFIFIVATLIGCSKAEANLQIVEAVVGYNAELPCNVSAEMEDDKLQILAWYRNGSATAFYSRDLRSEDGAGEVSSEDGPGGRYRLVESEDYTLNLLEISSIRPSDTGIYRCLADFESSPAHNMYVQLVVIEPPQHMWMIYENGTHVTSAAAGSNTSQNIGPYYVGDTIHLICVAFGGRPLATLTWWAEQKMLKDTCTPLSEHRIRSDVERGPLRREDHGLVLTCMANNNQKTPPLSIDAIIDMFLPPELVSVRDLRLSMSGLAAISGRVHAGDTLHLQCRVLGARPTPSVMWRLNDEPLTLEQNVTLESSQRLVTSEIKLVINREYDESQVTCCVPAYQRSAEQYVCAQALPVAVLYAPSIKINVNCELENNTLHVVKGANVTLNCSYEANPSVYLIIWFHGDDILNEDENGEPTMLPTIELTNVDVDDAGEYFCSATNDEGTTYSDPITVDVVYPPFCEDATIAEFGLAESDTLDINCNVKANPTPVSYRWIVVKEAINSSIFKSSHPHSTLETDNKTLVYQRPNRSAFNTIFCWGVNEIIQNDMPDIPCTFLVTDETVPQPPTNCAAIKSATKEIIVSCEEGHNGGLAQKFNLTVESLETSEKLVSIISLEPKFIIQEPKANNYKLIIAATNEKGISEIVQINKENIIAETDQVDIVTMSAVPDLTTLTLALCGGVALIALAACGLVLCAHERGSRHDLPRALSDPPLCAYNTEESNCETCHDSDDSEYNVRRTESFKRAVSRYPSKNFDIRRTNSFHSARYMNDLPDPESFGKYSEQFRHAPNCRVHSMQNISRKREMDALCDHLVMHLPPEPNYQIPKPVSNSVKMNTFYTMPRKLRNKSVKQISDDASVITQNSDGFSLPPPPDEFGTYRAATKIKDFPTKSTPLYTTIARKNSRKSKDAMNTVGIPTVPTVSVTQPSIYSYPDSQDIERATGNLTTFQMVSRSRESGI